MITITGGTGFIGTHLTARFKDPTLVENHLIRSHEYQPGVLYHLAAYGNHHSQDNPDEIYQANIVNLVHILKNIKKKEISLYNFSTSSVELPVQTHYSSSKLIGEKLVNLHGMLYNKPVFNIRPLSIFGEGEADHRFIPLMVYRLIKKKPITIDPDAEHDWTHVEDFIDTLLSIKEPGTYEIGTGVARSNLDVFNKIVDILGIKPFKIEYAKIRNYDTKDWKSRTPIKSDFDKRLEQTVRYYEQRYSKDSWTIL